jgi:uncharacterized protein (TIGR02594 family)
VVNGARHMRFKTRFMLAAGCVCLLGLSVPALSLPKPKGAEQHHPRNAQAPHAKKNKIAQRLKVHANARRVREERAMRLVSMPIAETPKRPMLGWPALVSEARKYMGTNPTARSRLWCATFMNMVLAKVGYSGTNSDSAKSFAQYGRRISQPQIGAIAVLTRGRTGGHVGVVSGIDKQGNPIIISGNHGKRVGEAIYPSSRVIAYVMPSGDRSEPTTQFAARTQANERRAPSEGGFDSPIAELIAAIEAEQNRSERPVRASAQAQLAQARAPAPRVAMRAGTLPLDPALAELLGISATAKARAPAPQSMPHVAPQAMPPAAPPPRQRQVQQLSQGRVASATPAGAYGFR